MNMKLMPLAAGVLVSLALAAIPAVASAGEFAADCKSGKNCTANVTGGAVELENANKEKISCTSVTGGVAVKTGTSTGEVQLLFHGCRETVTFFKFTCSNVKEKPGTITTNVMPSHNIWIDDTKKTPGVLLTGVNVTYECAGAFDQTVTGEVIGHIENPECGKYKTHHTITFEKHATINGTQKYATVTNAAPYRDLTSNNDAGGAYFTTALIGTQHLTYQGGDEVDLTC